MNRVKELKRLPLNRLVFFERLYSEIEQEAIEAGDERLNNEGGVSEQLQAIREAIYELRTEQGIPIPPVNIEAQTLKLKGSIKE